MRFANRPLTRAVTLTVSLGLAAVSLSALAPNTTAAAVLTNYGYSNTAWATQVVGGKLPAGSGETAHVVQSCTRKAGITKSNHIAGVNLGGAVKVSGVKSDSKTYRDSKGHHSWSENYTAKVDIGDGAAIIKGLTTESHSWVDNAGKFHAKSRLTGTIKIGSAPALELPDIGPIAIPIPGVGTITLGHNKTVVTSWSASNARTALVVELDATDSTVKLGRAQSAIIGDVPQGVMGGIAYSSKVSLLNGTVTSGKTAPLVVPCKGTFGKWRLRNTAGVDIPGVADVGVTRTAVFGSRSADGSAKTITRNAVARASLAGGKLVISGIRSEAKVVKSTSGKVTPTWSAAVLEITANGKHYSLVPNETLNLPGLGVITAGKVTKTKNKITVRSVYIKLFPGTAAESIVELGVSVARIAPKG